MSWAKLAANSRSSALPDKDPTDIPSTTASRRDSNVSSAGSTSSVRSMFKRLSVGKSGNGDAQEKGSDGAWKSLKRMSISVDSKNLERNSPLRASDGAGGKGILDVARNALQQQHQDETLDRANRKMSLALRKLGKAQFGLVSLLS